MLNYEGDSGCHGKTWRERAEGISRRRQWVDLIHCMPRIYEGTSPQQNFSLSSLEILREPTRSRESSVRSAKLRERMCIWRVYTIASRANIFRFLSILRVHTRYPEDALRSLDERLERFLRGRER